MRRDGGDALRKLSLRQRGGAGGAARGADPPALCEAYVWWMAREYPSRLHNVHTLEDSVPVPSLLSTKMQLGDTWGGGDLNAVLRLLLRLSRGAECSELGDKRRELSNKRT